MDDLVQFLKERLDEDFEAARLVLGVNVMADIKRGKPAPRWVPSPEGDAGIWDTSGTPRVRFVWARERDHIVRHDPARVLAEVDAKRRIVKLHGRATLRAGGGAQYYATATVCRSCEPNHQFPEQSWPCPTLRLLALPYAGHEAYREEWRP